MGWRGRSIVVGLLVGSASACEERPETDDDGPGIDSGDLEAFEFPDVPAMERCWRWDSPIATSLFGIVATTDGDLVVAGANPTAVVRLSPDGEERWTLRPQNVAISTVVALPDGAFAVLGRWALGSLAFARAYDADGIVAWEAKPTSGFNYLAGWWWAEREMLVVVGEGPTFEAFDSSGALVQSFDFGEGYGESPPRLTSIAPFGDGFVVVGGTLGDPGTSHAAAYDGEGMYRWKLGHDDDGAFVRDVASWDGSWAVLANDGLDISRIDVEGDDAWTWSADGIGSPSIAIASDGRTYVSALGRTPHALFGLSPDGEIETVVELEDAAPNGTDIAWSDGRVYVSMVEQPSHVDCWEPP